MRAKENSPFLTLEEAATLLCCCAMLCYVVLPSQVIIFVAYQAVDAEQDPHDCCDQIAPAASADEAYQTYNKSYEVERCDDFAVLEHIYPPYFRPEAIM